MIPYTNIDRKLTQYQQEDLSNIVQQCKTQSSFKLADIKRYKNYQDTITTYDCSKFNQAISSLSTTLFNIRKEEEEKTEKLISRIEKMIKKSKTKFVHLGDRYVPRYYANTNVLNTGIYLDKQTKSPHLILTLPAEYITPKTKFYDVKFINTPQSKVQVLSPITAKNYDDEFILAKYKFDPNPWDKDMFIYGKENTIIENLATKKYKDKTFLMEFNSIELPQKCHKMTYSKKMSNDETYTTKLNLIKIGEQFLRCDEIKKSIKILNELDKLNITNVKIHQSSDDISRTQIYLDGNSRFRATIGSIDEEFIVSK